MSPRAILWLLGTALAFGLAPAIDIGWALAHNRMPVPWWCSTRFCGAPSFFLLGQLLGDWWVPTNVVHMSIERHLYRWTVFVFVNVYVWVSATALGIWAFESLRTRALKPR